MEKRLLCRISVFIVAFMLFIPTNQKLMAASLTDIPSTYEKEIEYLIANKVISGYPDKTFRPNNQVTREEAAVIIGQVLGLDPTKRKTKFSDVDKSSYASGYIQSAVDQGIIAGYNDGTFRPKGNITRGEVAYLLKPTFKLAETSAVLFSDVSVSEHRYPFVNSLVTAGLAIGYPNGTFKPDEAVTRTEFALIVARGMNKDFRVKYEIQSLGESMVKATTLNVRSGPSTSYPIIGSLKQGAVVSKYQVQESWVYISYGGLTGYVSNSYLTNVVQSETPTPEPELDPVPAPGPKGRVITIDAGHGGTDVGAVGFGLYEKEINLSVALKVQKILEQKGIKVIMTRNDDTFLSLDRRVEIGVAAKADTFVSIHANSFTSDSANGTETFYSTAALNPRAEKSKQLATFIQNRLYKALETKDRGVKTAGFKVIKTNPLPAVLVELGFVSNKEDAKKLASEQYRQASAEAISLGIIDYYEWLEQ